MALCGVALHSVAEYGVAWRCIAWRCMALHGKHGPGPGARTGPLRQLDFVLCAFSTQTTIICGSWFGNFPKKHPIWNRQASLKVDLRLFSILEDYHVWWKKAMDGCGTADFFETAAKQIVCVAKYILCSWYFMYQFRFTHFHSNFADNFLEREHLKTITSNIFLIYSRNLRNSKL